jgi:hypothetical protein
MLLLGLLEPQYEGTAHIETSITVNQTTRRNIPEDFKCCSFSSCVVLSATQAELISYLIRLPKVLLLHCTERSNPKNNAMSCSLVAASFWVAVLLSMRGGGVT